MTLDYPSYTSALLTLLDRIELETDDPIIRRFCRQRFTIAEDHGLTVEFGELASGTIQ